MTNTTYGHYIKKLAFRDEGPGFYRQILRVSGDSVGVPATIEYGKGEQENG